MPILLLLALLLRAGIPAGYMLAPGGGLPRIVPCTGVAAPSHRRGHQKRSDRTPCAFAVIAEAASPATPPPLAAAPAPFPPVLAPALATGPARLPASLRPPATGPPSA
jgi:hypothetical protein